MENEKQETAVEATSANVIEDAVLKYFANEHPDDEEKMEAVIGLLGDRTEVPANELLSAVYKGLRYDGDVEKARSEGYLSGVNESIEVEKRKLQPQPTDDGGLSEPPTDLTLLSNVRKSVWDL